MGSYTGTPKTWTTAETVTAAMLNAELRDPLAALGGAFTSYTPTLGGFTAGNGTATGGYTQFGKLVFFRAQFTFGSTSAAASAIPTLSLPVTAASGGNPGSVVGSFFDASPFIGYQSGVYFPSTTTVGLTVLGTSGIQNAASTTSPFTWTTSDFLRASGWYEAA